MWDVIVSVPDHCLSFYFIYHSLVGWLECLVMSLTLTLEIIFYSETSQTECQSSFHCMKSRV